MFSVDENKSQKLSHLLSQYALKRGLLNGIVFETEKTIIFMYI